MSPAVDAAPSSAPHPARQRITCPRTVYRDEIGYYFDRTAQPWRALQPPTVTRVPVPYDIAALLDITPGAEAVIRDRVMGDPATGQATSYIPAASPPSCLSWLLPTRGPAASTTG